MELPPNLVFTVVRCIYKLAQTQLDYKHKRYCIKKQV